MASQKQFVLESAEYPFTSSNFHHGVKYVKNIPPFDPGHILLRSKQMEEGARM